jgi:hypothetical protein
MKSTLVDEKTKKHYIGVQDFKNYSEKIERILSTNLRL